MFPDLLVETCFQRQTYHYPVHTSYWLSGTSLYNQRQQQRSSQHLHFSIDSCHAPLTIVMHMTSNIQCLYIFLRTFHKKFTIGLFHHSFLRGWHCTRGRLPPIRGLCPNITTWMATAVNTHTKHHTLQVIRGDNTHWKLGELLPYLPDEAWLLPPVYTEELTGY